MINNKFSFLLSSKKPNFISLKNIIVFFMGCVFLMSCEQHVQEEEGLPMGGISCDSNVSYMLNIRPIIDANCLECHAGSQPPNLSTYESLSANAINVQRQVVTRLMPQGGSLTDEEIEFISCWVDNGALNN